MTVNTVLIPVDRSERSKNAVSYAAEVFPDSTLEILHVVDTGYEWPEGPGWPKEWQQQARQKATELVEEAAETARDHGNVAKTEVIWGSPHQKILAFADSSEADHLMMGSTGKSMTGRILLGSVAETIVKRANIPVTLVRFEDADRAIEPPERVLTPIDGSESASNAFEQAVRWFPKAEHTLLYVCEFGIDPHMDVTGTYLAELIQREEVRAEEILDEMTKRANSDIELHTEFRFGSPAATIIQFIEEEGIEHVVVGRRGRSHVKRLLMGSVAEAVATRAHVPVTVNR